MTTEIPQGLQDRLVAYRAAVRQQKVAAARLKRERRELAVDLQDAGVPVQQIARFLGLRQRTHVHAILRGVA